MAHNRERDALVKRVNRALAQRNQKVVIYKDEVYIMGIDCLNTKMGREFGGPMDLYKLAADLNVTNATQGFVTTGEILKRRLNELAQAATAGA
jgi:hypothetical protein